MRFALALVSGAPLLVLDEPTVGMDVEARHGFWTTHPGSAAARHDRAVRHALPRGGRRLRRPDRAHGGRPGRGRRPGRPRSRRGSARGHPGDAAGAGRAALRGCPAWRARGAARRRRRSAVQRLRRRDPRPARALARGARHRDRRRRSRAGVPRAHRRRRQAAGARATGHVEERA